MKITANLYVRSIPFILLTFLIGCCPDRVEPTFGHTIIPSEPRVGDTVEFIDRSNANDVYMDIYADSIGNLTSNLVHYSPNSSIGQLGYSSTFTNSGWKWEYPIVERYYTFDTSNRFRTKFVINRKISRLIISRFAKNYYRRCDGLMMHENSPIEVTKRDTIYVQ